MSDRIDRAFYSSMAIRVAALGISNAFNRMWHAGLLHKFKTYGISDPIFGFISSPLSNRMPRVVVERKFFQGYPVNAGVPQGAILSSKAFLQYCYLC